MRKPRLGTLVEIDNAPEGKARTTSYRRAADFVARGRAEWVSHPDRIRFLCEPEMLMALRELDAARELALWWRGIEAQRGGRISCRWRARPSGGVTVMQARVVVEAPASA